MEQKEELFEMKQDFLSSAISDIAADIQLADTKVSIIMGSLAALLAGILACCDHIEQAFSRIRLCSWLGTATILCGLIFFLSLFLAFLFGVLTIRVHHTRVAYKSKWFILQSVEEYSCDTYIGDINAMTKNDIIENMAIELYKLNDINRQKSRTMKWSVGSFSCALITGIIAGIILVVSASL